MSARPILLREPDDDDLHGRVAALELAVASLTRHRANPDGRLGRVLGAIYGYVRTAPWTAGELIEDARRGDPELWLALDNIVGERSPAIALGRWLAKHVGCDADGFRLDAAGRCDEVRRYRVSGS